MSGYRPGEGFRIHPDHITSSPLASNETPHRWRLLDLLNAAPSSGGRLFRWRRAYGDHQCGDIAGGDDGRLTIDGQSFREADICWLLMTDEWPRRGCRAVPRLDAADGQFAAHPHAFPNLEIVTDAEARRRGDHQPMIGRAA